MKSNKCELVKFRIYPIIRYAALEKWLKTMSLEGWHLVRRKFSCIYYFESGPKVEKEYFVWAWGFGAKNDSGQFDINLRYPFLIKTYGVKKKKSKLNRNSIEKFDTIIEVDPDKINDIGYKELVSDRNRLYKLAHIREMLMLLTPFLMIGLLLFLIFVL